MKVTEPVAAEQRAAGADTTQAEEEPVRPTDAWLLCPYTDAEIDAIFDAWKR